MTEYPTYEIGGPLARELSDLIGILSDLQRTFKALKRLQDTPDDEILCDALFASSLIAYRRCFTSGARSALKRSHILDIGNNAEELHDHLIAQANKLAAHSVNPFENTKIGVLVHEDAVVGSAFFSMRLISWQPDDLNQWMRLIKVLLRQYVQPLIESKQAEVVQEAKNRSIHAIRRGGILQHVAPGPASANERR